MIRTTRKRGGVIALLLTCGAGLSWPAPVNANGRFPSANQLIVDPQNPEHLFVRTTFGLLNRPSANTPFGWICEEAVQTTKVQDPTIAVGSDGALIVALSNGTSVSRGGCDWQQSTGFSNTDLVSDFTGAPSVQGRFVAAVLHVTGKSSSTQLSVSDDDGRTWTIAGLPLDSNFMPITLEVAPSNPQRIYVTGFRADDGTGVFARSPDGGMTWSMGPIGFGAELNAYIAAIDQANADRVYVRISDTAGDKLLITDNGGASFREALTIEGALLGFALSPDGTEVVIGGPKAGVRVAKTADLVFSAASSVAVECLTWAEAGLYACAREAVDHFTIGLSNDRGRTFAPLVHLGDLQPLACAADAGASRVCKTPWETISTLLGVPSPSAEDAAVPPAPADSGATRDRGAAEVDVGRSDADPELPTDATGPSDNVVRDSNADRTSGQDQGDASSCACRSARSASPPDAAAVIVAVGAILLARRRSHRCLQGAPTRRLRRLQSATQLAVSSRRPPRWVQRLQQPPPCTGRLPDPISRPQRSRMIGNAWPAPGNSRRHGPSSSGLASTSSAGNSTLRASLRLPMWPDWPAHGSEHGTHSSCFGRGTWQPTKLRSPLFGSAESRSTRPTTTQARSVLSRAGREVAAVLLCSSPGSGGSDRS